MVNAEDSKKDHVLSWTTYEGEYNRLHFQWRMDAEKKALELLEKHNSGECKLISLDIVDYEQFLR